MLSGKISNRGERERSVNVPLCRKRNLNDVLMFVWWSCAVAVGGGAGLELPAHIMSIAYNCSHSAIGSSALPESYQR